jgi:DNA polymerase-3 subunit delta'
MAESDNTSQTPGPRLLPWHAPAAEQLRLAWTAGRLPHALLLQGPDGLGKRYLAAWLSCAVLCESPGATLQCCGSCASCKLFAARTHPDVLWVAPEEDKQQISVDQVRLAIERLSKTSYRQGYKIAIVVPAHQMTPNAANSVLKTLEEPSARSLLILVTSQPSLLPPTVRSRCQKVTVRRPSAAQAAEWLQTQAAEPVNPQLLEFAGGAPLRALEYADGRFGKLDDSMRRSLGQLLAGQADVTQVATEWANETLSERLTWLDLWLTALARGAISGIAELITFGGGTAHLPSPPRALNISAVYDLVDRARALRAQLARTALQRELAVEAWIYALQDVLAPAVRLNARLG